MSRLAAEVRTSSDYVRRSSSGSFAILAAIRRASSRVSSLAAMSASDCVQLQQGFATGVMRADRQFDGKNYRDRMSALGGGFNRSTQHLLILLEKEVCDGGDCTDMVHVAAEG